jgi:hypothetical protein
LTWESKLIDEENKLEQIRDFFEMVAKEIKPYNILQLKGLDKKLEDRARELQRDPNYRQRRIREERKKEIVGYEKDGDDYNVKVKIGERFRPGTSYVVALKNAYSEVGTNISKFSKRDGSTKYIAIVLYSGYIVIFSTLVPIYPIFGTLDEAKKLKEPITESLRITAEQMDEYFEPISESTEPPFEYMMMLAR